MKHTDADYLAFDTFAGDEAEITCRTKAMRTARKPHICYGSSGERNHSISSGDRYRHERALIDGSFWGEYRMCCSCLDLLMAEFENEDD